MNKKNESKVGMRHLSDTLKYKSGFCVVMSNDTHNNDGKQYTLGF